jgi:aryl-alcohol dehydrogenase-like predicted oxidoreductase
MELRKLGRTDIEVTPVAMGCWPISGITSVDVTEAASLATLEAAFDAGINFFDTAYCYGFAGESESMIGRVFGRRREQIVIATKGGLHWENGKQAHDGSPATLKRECEESLRRLGTERVELLYLHAPDPKVPIADSAGALKELLDAGKTRSVGLSNATVEHLREFSAVCPLAAFQPHYNMLQREIEADELPWCRERGVSVIVYWPLMKGLLAGKLARDHVFDVRDGRRKYPMFQREEWTRNQDFLDDLRPIAAEARKSVAELVINWTIHQAGISAALCGAKRPEQIRANAGGMGWRLSANQMERIQQAIGRRGTVASRGAV